MFLFDLFDAVINAWYHMLVTCVNHPWLPLVVGVFGICADIAIKKYDKHKYPND